MQIFRICLFIVNDTNIHNFFRCCYLHLNYFYRGIYGDFSFYKCFLFNIHNFFRCCCLHLNCFYCGIYNEFSFYKCFLSNINNFFRCCCLHLNCFYCGIYNEFCFLQMLSFFGLIFKILPHNLCLVLNKFLKNCSVFNYRCERQLGFTLSLY